jgi:hypothetical protein
MDPVNQDNPAEPVVNEPAAAEPVVEAEAKPSETPKAEETQPKKVNITDHHTGDNYDLSPQEVVDLAQWALMENSKQRETKDAPPVEDVTTETRIEKLEKQIKDSETKSRNEKQGQVIMTKINDAAGKYDLTKEGGPLTEKIKMMTLLKLNNNPRLDPATVFAEETKSYMDIFEKRNDKKIANDKVQGAMNSTLRGGAMPVVDTSKKYTADDLKGQGSRAALTAFLKQS